MTDEIQSQSSKTTPDKFTEQAQAAQRGLIREIFEFLRHTKKWWLAPVIVILMLVGVLFALGSTAIAPLIYTLF